MHRCCVEAVQRYVEAVWRYVEFAKVDDYGKEQRVIECWCDIWKVLQPNTNCLARLLLAIAAIKAETTPRSVNSNAHVGRTWVAREPLMAQKQFLRLHCPKYCVSPAPNCWGDRAESGAGVK